MPDNMSSQPIHQHLIAVMMVLMLALVSCRTQMEDADVEGETQEVKVDVLGLRVTTSTQKVTTSEMFEVILQVRHDPGYQIQLPEIPEKLGHFFVFETHSSPARLDSSGWVELKRVYTLEPDILGVNEVPEFLVTAKDPEGKVVKVSSKPMAVTVTSVLVGGEKNIRDIAPDTRPSTAESVARWPIALLLANVLVVGCLLMVWRKWRRGKGGGGVGVMNDWGRFLTDGDDGDAGGSLQIEPVLAQVIAGHYGLDLKAVDFQGLVDQLETRKITVPGLNAAIENYTRLEYAEYEPTEEEVTELYQQFNVIISELPGKVCVS